MNNLTVFENKQFGKIRTIFEGGGTPFSAVVMWQKLWDMLILIKL